MVPPKHCTDGGTAPRFSHFNHEEMYALVMDTVLFFDDWSLQRRDNLDRVLGKPEWVPEATLEDGLTEGTWNFPCVWFDRADGKWKAVYGGAVTHQPSGPHRQRSFQPRTQLLLYAESKDGVHWEKPDVTQATQSQVPIRYAPNQVYGSASRLDGCVSYDAHAQGNPLKYVFCEGEGSEAMQGLATSGDGIHWTVVSTAKRDGTMDGPTPCYYNAYKDAYVITTRRSIVDRRVAHVETKDFRTFSKPKVALSPDPEDPALVEFYGMPTFAYEGMFIGLLWRFHTDAAEIGSFKRHGPLDCALAYSYDGDHFNRAFHAPFIPRNEPGEHGGGAIYVSSMVVGDDHVIRFYSGASLAEHFRNQELNDGALLLHRLRLDGFMYLKTRSVRGLATTKAMTFRQPSLKLNVRAPYGSVRVQVLDDAGKPVPGLGLDDCIPFTGDELFLEPRWRDAGLEKVLNKTVFLEIELAEGELYAIRGEFERAKRWENRPFAER